jgi:hypothetical protein
MANYIRIGNRTFQEEEARHLTPKQIEEIKADGARANQKRFENMRQSLGMQPNAPITLNVTPAGIAARKIAIAAEEAKIAAETQTITDELGPETPSFVAEAEAPKEVKKSKKAPAAIAST